jgi:hypothetical protein
MPTPTHSLVFAAGSAISRNLATAMRAALRIYARQPAGHPQAGALQRVMMLLHAINK